METEQEAILPELTELLYEIESFALNSGVEFMDAIIHFCGIKNIDVETMATIISQNESLKGRLFVESMQKNLIREKFAVLPFL
jgi:hypothetical protein